MCSARRRSRSSRKACRHGRLRRLMDAADPTCAPFELVPCDVFITEATFGLPVFRHHDAPAKSPSCCVRLNCFPSARIWSAPIRSARRSASSPCCGRPVTTRRSICTARWRRSPHYYQSRGIELGAVELVRGAKKAELAGTITICPPSGDDRICGRGGFPIRCAAFASGWMRVRARARQRGVDHCLW